MATSAPSAPVLFPTTLVTASPEAGRALAQQLATSVLTPAGESPTDMAASLRRQPAQPSFEMLTAVYFHAISIANQGWR